MESIKSILLNRKINMSAKFKKTFEREFNIHPESAHAPLVAKKEIEYVSRVLKSSKFETLPVQKKHTLMKNWVRKMHIFQEAINIGLIPFQVSGVKGGTEEK